MIASISPLFSPALSLTIPQFLILSISATVLTFILISLFWHLQCQLGADSGKAIKSQDYSFCNFLLFGMHVTQLLSFKDASVRPLAVISREKYKPQTTFVFTIYKQLFPPMNLYELFFMAVITENFKVQKR